MQKIGDKLNNLRKQKGLSLDEVSNATRIRKEYLEAIENSQYDFFPSEVYVKGFLRNYGQFLGLGHDYVLSLYRRERETLKEGATVQEFSRKQQKLQSTAFRFKPTTLTIILSIIGLVSLIVFFGYQLILQRQKPILQLTSPLIADVAEGQEYNFDTFSEKLIIRGKIGVGDVLYLNEDQVDTRGLPEFEIPDIELEVGENVYELESRNQFGIRSTLTLVVIRSEQPEEIQQGA